MLKFFWLSVLPICCFILAGCKDNSENLVTRNAKGIIIDIWDSSDPESEIWDISLWINNQAIVWSMIGNNDKVVWSSLNEKEFIPYYSVTMHLLHSRGYL